MIATYSPGWNARVSLGSGQLHMRDALRSSIRHPSRVWHDAAPLRSFGRSPGTAHRLIHRLAALGVIAIQTTLGRDGGVRFTFGVHRWRTAPVRRGASWRMRTPAIAGQLAAFWKPEQAEPEPEPNITNAPDPKRPESTFQPPPPSSNGAYPGETFGEKMRRYGLKPDLFPRSDR